VIFANLKEKKTQTKKWTKDIVLSFHHGIKHSPHGFTYISNFPFIY